MKYVLSTIAWVESIAKKEIERVWWKIEETTDRLVTFSWWIELIPRVNLWSRVWNKMYLLLAEKEWVKDFDSLFDIVNSISWKAYFKKDFPIVVKSTSIRSELFAERTIQSISKKAIIKSRVWANWTINEDSTLEKMEILILFIDNKLRVLLNTSWKALHMRWYREKSWDAPIKESLAAALVLLSGWKFKEPFYDFFCWSGTVWIEALMIAKNIAPWLKRKFAFEKFGIVNSEITENERHDARKKEFNWEYTIRCSDIDPEMVELAKQNSIIAWLWWEINFEVKDFRDVLSKELYGTLVSNPPYGDRLKDDDLKWIYNNIDKIFRVNPALNWWIISSYLEFDSIINNPKTYKKRKLYNWGELCYFWKKNNK